MAISTEIAERLRGIDFLSVLEPEQLDELAGRFSLEHFRFGEMIFSQGDAGDRLYLVHSGKVRIVMQQEDGREVTLKSMEQGEHFGEIALLEDTPRTAGARAAADTTLLALSRGDFDEVIQRYPELRQHLETVISNRVMASFLRVCTSLGKGIRARDFQALLSGVARLELEGGRDLDLPEPPALYIVEEGQVEVRCGDEVVHTVRVGESLGEDALCQVETGLRAAASGNVKLFRLDRHALTPLMEQQESGLQHYLDERARFWQSVAGIEPAVQEEEEEEVLEPLSQLEAEVRFVSEAERRAERPRLAVPDVITRFPWVQQQEAADCGAACLAMLLRFYGKNVSLGRIRDLANVGTQGATMRSIMDAGEELGFEASASMMNLEHLEKAHLPAIVHWKGLHYIIVYRISPTHVYVADPDLGRLRHTREEFCKHWTGGVVELVATTDVREVEESHTYWYRFLEHFKGHHRLLAEVLLAGIGLQILALTLPIFTQQIVDRVVISRSVSLLTIMLAAMVFAQLCRVLLGGARSYVMAHISRKVSFSMMGAFYRHVLALPQRFFGVRKPGDILNRFADNEKIKNLFMGKPIEVVLDLIMVVLYLVLMFYYSVTLTFLVLALVVPFVILTLIASPIMKRRNKLAFAAVASQQSALIEAINGIETIKAMALERRARGIWEGLFARTENLNYQTKMIALWFGTISRSLNAFTTLFLLWLGANLVIDGEMTIGQLMAFQAMVGGIFGPILNFVNLWDQIQQATVSADRLAEVLDSRTELELQESTISPARLQGYVRFERVFFRYGSSESPYILKNISFELAPGESLAIVGRSGSGKTTLARVLLRLYPLREGRILLDDIDIQDLELSSLRRNVATVLQEIFLFKGSIRENIVSGTGPPVPGRVVEAAKMAAAHEFILDLPQGYDTELQEGGTNLSGGQRQRICLARAFYRNPSILILDEATSALDPRTEATVQENMAKFLERRTAIMIAHRMSTIRRASRILVLENGEMDEMGTHEELMARRGSYYSLCTQQLSL